jgi:hypothetical protein
MAAINAKLSFKEEMRENDRFQRDSIMSTFPEEDEYLGRSRTFPNPF